MCVDDPYDPYFDYECLILARYISDFLARGNVEYANTLYELEFSRMSYESLLSEQAALDPLTEQQWMFVKQEAQRFGIPKELLGSTLAAEIMFDTDWVNTVYDVSTGFVGATADFARKHHDQPLFEICYGILEGFHEYFGLADELEPRGFGYGMAPGIAHMHAGPAVRTENYFNQAYPGQDFLPDLGPTNNQEGVRLRVLLSDEGSITYAAAYLRWWADIRKGAMTEHTHDLTDIDMTIIYTAYRCDAIACYGSIEGYQDAQTPTPYGHPEDFSLFLPIYRNRP